MDFEEAADAVYAAPAADFIATRNELAKQLKADGDAIGSTRLKALRKPTVAAWLANLVARKLPDELDDLLALGDEFREATADLDGERLRELTPKRHRLLDKLSKEAARLAAKEGQKVSADVGQKLRETLDAALVDPAAGDAVREGRLSSALRHVGFGVVDENGEPSNVTPLTDERRQAARDRRKAQRAETETAEEERAAAKRKQAEEDEREAAERALAKQAFEEAVAAAQAAEARVEELDTQLDNAREALSEAQARVHSIGAELDEARRAARDAQKESREARKRYNRL
ncbi:MULTISPECIES: hypothetical protein [Kribbella]|uniref:Transposase n=1 Tax=Kribbella pratensis TaxID=2512112 RepID=A0ABY2FGU0_9ACTN|nr:MULTISPECIES: hypothetical protein [Kribbella]TDW90599.1 hypothetical protein EV137_4420 [Kribbella pratensis]TDW98331.1 hypothetical protein EV647_3038 [Kribbella sp. VKM Ac-2566]